MRSKFHFLYKLEVDVGYISFPPSIVDVAFCHCFHFWTVYVTVECCLEIELPPSREHFFFFEASLLDYDLSVDAHTETFYFIVDLLSWRWSCQDDIPGSFEDQPFINFLLSAFLKRI